MSGQHGHVATEDVRMLAENDWETTDYWATEGSLGRRFLVGRAPPDGVIKDEYSLCTGVLFQDVLDLCIVSRLDLVLVCKVILDAGVVDELEPAEVKTERIALSSSVTNDYRTRVLADVGPWDACGRFVDIVVRRLGIKRSMVVEGRLDVAGGEHWDGHCEEGVD